MSVTTRSTNPKIMDDNVAKLEKYMEENAALPEVTSSDEGKVLIANSSGAWEAANINADNVIYSEDVSVKDKIDDMLGGIVQYKDYTLSQALTIGAGEAKVASITEDLPLTTISAVIWNYSTSGFDSLIPMPNSWYGSIRIMIKNTGSTSVTIPVTVSIRVYYI